MGYFAERKARRLREQSQQLYVASAESPLLAGQAVQAAKINNWNADELLVALEARGVELRYRFKCRFEREDGAFREVSLVSSSEDAARELAERRCREQYGDLIREDVFGHTARELLEKRPDLHQDNYKLVDVERIR